MYPISSAVKNKKKKCLYTDKSIWIEKISHTHELLLQKSQSDAQQSLCLR